MKITGLDFSRASQVRGSEESCWLNAVWDPRLHPGPEEKDLAESCELQTGVKIEVLAVYQCGFSGAGHHAAFM